jgi:hypothetical protein
MSKPTSDCAAKSMTDTSPATAQLNGHPARRGASLPEIDADVRDPSASSQVMDHRIVRVIDSNSEM